MDVHQLAAKPVIAPKFISRGSFRWVLCPATSNEISKEGKDHPSLQMTRSSRLWGGMVFPLFGKGVLNRRFQHLRMELCLKTSKRGTPLGRVPAVEGKVTCFITDQCKSIGIGMVPFDLCILCMRSKFRSKRSQSSMIALLKSLHFQNPFKWQDQNQQYKLSLMERSECYTV